MTISLRPSRRSFFTVATTLPMTRASCILQSEFLPLDDARALDDDGVQRHRAILDRRRAADRLDHVHAFDDLAEYRILPVPLRVRRDANEELAGRAVGVICDARHRDDTGTML